MGHLSPLPSTMASEDELGAHAAVGWHESVAVSLVRRLLTATVEVSMCIIHCCTALLSVEG